MKRFYIMQRELDGNDYQLLEVFGETQESAIAEYINNQKIPKDEQWLYYAVDADERDESQRVLKESCCSSWDEYYDDMYLSRPIEL